MIQAYCGSFTTLLCLKSFQAPLPVWGYFIQPVLPGQNIFRQLPLFYFVNGIISRIQSNLIRCSLFFLIYWRRLHIKNITYRDNDNRKFLAFHTHGDKNRFDNVINVDVKYGCCLRIIKVRGQLLKPF